MKALVVHNQDGQIILLTLPKSGVGTGIGILLEPGESLLELDLPDDLPTSSLAAIHREYSVDIENKRLVRQS